MRVSTVCASHSLAGFDFHDHRPAVQMHQHLLRDLDERTLWHRNSTSGSSRIASSASLIYQRALPHSISAVWPTSLAEPRGCSPHLSDRLTPGNSTSLKLSTHRLNPHLSARYRGQPISALSRIGIVQLSMKAGGPPNQVVLPLFDHNQYSVYRRPCRLQSSFV